MDWVDWLEGKSYDLLKLIPVSSKKAWVSYILNLSDINWKKTWTIFSHFALNLNSVLSYSQQESMIFASN